jgi:TPR repeat protein
VKRWFYLYFLGVLSITALPRYASAATQCPIAVKCPTVASIVQNGEHPTGAADVTVLDIEGRARQGVQVGEELNDVHVEVPADDTVVVAAPNGHDALTLQPGTRTFFHYTGTLETVSVEGGKVFDEDEYGFFSHITGQGGIVLTAPLDPAFSIDVRSTAVTVSVTSGIVQASLLGSSSVGSRSGESGTASSSQAAYVERVDSVSAKGRGTIAYALGRKATVDVSLADDEASAHRGDAQGEYNLGYRYEQGRGVAQDYAIALSWYKLAAAQGYAAAQNSLGFMYWRARGVARDYTTALHWYQLAAAQGYAAAEDNIGLIYEFPDSVVATKPDYETAMRWYELAAAQGLAAAEENIGGLIDRLRTKDHATALYWYQLAAAQGLAAAEERIGSMYEYGDGMPKDYASALHWYQLAATQGDCFAESIIEAPQGDCEWDLLEDHGALYRYQIAAAPNNAVAEYDIGFMNEDGGDPAAALHWYQLAASQGYAGAEYRIGEMYCSGLARALKLLPQDCTTALHWYELAAAQGYARAEQVLGDMYEQGNGVEQNYATALHWYELAAAQGYSEADFDIGKMYYYGRGVPQNFASALHWYLLSTNGPAGPDDTGHFVMYYIGQIYEHGYGTPVDYATALQWYKYDLSVLACSAGEMEGCSDDKAAVHRVQQLLNQQQLHHP